MKNYWLDRDDIVSKWNKTGLLKGIKDKSNLAYLFENQRLMNENLSLYNCNFKQNTDWNGQFKRISIPVIRRVFDEDFLGHKLITFKTMRKPSENENELTAKTRILKSKWERVIWKSNRTAEFQGQKYCTGLDAECESVLVFANLLKNELSQEIVNDLINNAGITMGLANDCLLSVICFINKQIKANWILVSPNIYQEYKNDFEVINPNKKIIVSENISDGNILMGSEEGYIFAPYVPLSPLCDDEDNKIAMMFRYDKKLIDKNDYGVIKWDMK